MFYSNLSKTVALSVGVLAMVFLISYFVFAWQEPTQAPPLGNVPAPLNIGFISQIKTGHLTVGSFISGTRVGIGMTPIYPLDVSGDVRWTGTLRGGTVPWARLSGYPSITAGSGLTGGGTLSASRTLNVGAGTGITVGAAAVNLTHPSLSCPAGEAIRVFNLGTGTRTCIPVGNGNGGMTYWRIAADGTSGAATVGQDQTVTIRGGTGITATRSTRDVTAALTHPSLSCPADEAIQIFNLGTGTRTCIPVGNGIEWPLRGPDGSVAAPSYSFSADGNTGIYRIGVNTLGFSTGGSERMRITSVGMRVAGTGQFTGQLDMNSQRITSVATPVAGTDAVNKDYVDAQAGGGGGDSFRYCHDYYNAWPPACSCPAGYTAWEVGAYWHTRCDAGHNQRVPAEMTMLAKASTWYARTCHCYR